MDIELIFNTIYNNISELLPNLIFSISIFLFFWLSGIFSQFLIIRIANKRGLNKQLLLLIGKIAKIGLIIFGLITSLGTFGINISALVAGLGLTGFALGFALKDVVSNLIAGSIILLHRPFKINDRIIVVGHEGKVIKIDLRYTTIESEDKKILLPNSILFTKEIIILN
ncbi:MAG: mechanosensitive ion channel domain-containing protein [Candidatus Neomarinimicrobiota bacterium]|jgi:small-conductance mechanosensitive channel|nr:mechanosensitive ion channel [Candidatus Neomarinimicrobiota bacterium]MEC9027192.1 mechanosensitive ion channel domain-containing protein [Candidatus Neomarinimicrobiota bacterium]MED5267067.1 mechanosensitive ion channel domain-containing protein [Candidatus Neomarinimicrobiota bacterium]|tara:strand:- start:237 stop:743 length:507 start_codon:yes stop_codon:yes gene_type:complete